VLPPTRVGAWPKGVAGEGRVQLELPHLEDGVVAAVDPQGAAEQEAALEVNGQLERTT